MFVPPVRRHGVLLPDGLEPVVFASLAVILTLAAWAVFSASRLSSDTSYTVVAGLNTSRIHSVAYIAPSGAGDALYVRHLGDDAPGEMVAWFPSSYGLHTLGTSSPGGDSVAVLTVSPSSSPLAQLRLVSLPTGSTIEVPGAFDYLSSVAWSRDGSHLAVSRSTTADEAGRVSALVFEVASASATVNQVAAFENVYQVAPVGYSIDGSRLFIVVIDQSGSSLWSERDGRVQRVATLSPGATRDWSLSPDGARLAFVDILGVGERSYAGRSLVIATGGIVDARADGNQVGAAWLPGSQAPLFGGPGGSVQLSGAPDSAAYVVPAQWSPDGSTLVATIYSASGGEHTAPSRSIELVTPDRRVILSDQDGSSFLGWVRDLN